MSSANNGFFNSQNHDRVYDADDFNKVFNMLAVSGIDLTNNANSLKVSAQSPNAMYVDVAIGSAIVNGGWIEPTSVTSLAIPTSSVSYNRYDAVVIEFNRADNTRAVALKVVQGVASSTPSYPDLTQTDNIYQIPLAYVLVEANASSISDSDITDVRSDYWLSANVRKATSEYLGIVKGGDTVTIDDEGTINVNIASRTQLGGVKVGQNLRITPDGTLNATGGGGGGASALSDLEDVDIDWETLTANQALLYDAVAQMWKNQTINTEPPSLVDLPDVNIENLQFGQVLRYNSTNGKWENCNWNEEPLSKIFEKVTIDALSTARYDGMTANVGDYAILAGGQGIGADVGTEAYNSELTKSVIGALGEVKYMGASAEVGLYALFAGGISGKTASSLQNGYAQFLNTLKTVYAIDNYLTAITSAPDLSVKRTVNGAKTSNYALFGGGHSVDNGGYSFPNNTSYNNIDAYDERLTLNTGATLSVARGYIATGQVDGKAIFAGGVALSGYGAYYSSGWYDPTQSQSKVVDVVDDSLTVSQAELLSVARSRAVGVDTPTHFVVAGGVTVIQHANSTQETTTASNVVEAYDASLTRMTLAPLSSARQATQNLTGVYKDGWVVFSGANSNANADAYDSSFTKCPTWALGQALSQARTYITAMSIGDYIIYAGGYASSAAQTTVDAYKVNIQG